MRIIAFTTSWWNTRDEGASRWSGEFGLGTWYAKTHDLFPDCRHVVACGTWSDPESCPSESIEVVNAGIKSNLPYCTLFWHYAGAAWQAGLTRLLDRDDWDLICALDTDCLIGSVDFNALLREFWGRPETILSPDWFDSIGGPFIAMKHQAAIDLVYSNPFPNLIHERSFETIPRHRCIEHRWAEIFRGKWWNPWPEIKSMRMDYPGQPARQTDFNAAMTWPFVRQPAPHFVGPYRQKHSAKPFRPEATEISRQGHTLEVVRP